ncbi:chemotaxis protein [Phenylobacterium hankyongense]|uniref:Chemotaxis protein n=1 Tax=Phenylobacterium hankyongense TaxID=1813876 RepID=A0A328B0J1_9CAUL|nr:HAMP domain-containing methyl-accepting chemotaxis protein [Phenylobacterium hankyongense]RAK59446.1 chemotaxis protein [Phenylobacterium hankyongense]
MFLNNLKISTKIMMVTGITSLLSGLMIVFSVFQLNAITATYNGIVERQSPAIVDTVRANRAAESLGANGYRTVVFDGASEDCRQAAAAARVEAQEMMRLFAEAKALAPERAAELQAFSDRAAQMSAGVLDAAAHGVANDNVYATKTMKTNDEKLKAFASDLTKFNTAWIADNNKASVAAAAASHLASVLLIGLGLVSLVGGVVFSLWMATSKISKPLVHLSGDMERLARSDFSVEVDGQDRRDEVGQMARSVQVFKTNGMEMQRLEKEAADQRRQAEEERARNEALQAEAARQQAQVVSSVATGLEKLSAGELTYRLSEAFAAEYEKLREDFNGAMEQLQETMKVISGSTQGIRSGTDEISQAADDLSKRTEQQAASLEETAAALDQITATVRKTAEGANHARDVVSAAKADAEHSGQVVRDAVAAMTEIENSAQQISQIIGVIDEIAFQTNLLALNAGVEAARAGDAGRGFAVVASEVRALAQRSASAAKEIKTLISASTSQVEQGVELVGETGNALTRIVAQVADINSVVSEIAASAQEQATGLHQVNTAVNQMDQVTQQNAAMVEQSTAASHSLAQEAEELGRLIGRFQVGAPAVISPPHRAAARPAAAPTRTALKTVSTSGRGGGAARKPEPTGDADSWEEF